MVFNIKKHMHVTHFKEGFASLTDNVMWYCNMISPMEYNIFFSLGFYLENSQDHKSFSTFPQKCFSHLITSFNKKHKWEGMY